MQQAVRPLRPADTAVPDAAPARARVRVAAAWARTPTGIAVLLTVLVGASLVLRLDGQRGWLWIDEGLSAGIASHPIPEIPGLLRQDGSPPLYYVLLHVWIGWFGTGEVALHGFSLVFALACIPVALWAGWSLFGARVGWTAALLAAGNPFLTYYGREARMYTLVAFLALVAAASFVHVFAFGRRRHLPVFAVSLALLLYTHNWALFGGLAAAVALVPCAWARREERGVLLRDAVIGFGAAGLAYLPWVPTLLYQLRHTGAPWSRVPSLRQAISEVDAVLGDERVLVALLLVGGAGAAALIAARRKRELAAIYALLLLALVPVAASWLTSQIEPNWATRYFAVIVGPILLAAAALLARARWQGVAALVLIVLFWTHPLGRITGERGAVPLAQKSNVKSIMRQVAPHLRPGDLVVSTHAEQVPVLAYYLPDFVDFATPMGAVADPGAFDWRDVVQRMEAATPERNLVPLLDRLPAGARVLLVAPVGRLQGDRNPKWFVLFHKRTDEWRATLRRDARFTLEGRAGTAAARVPGTSVYGLLFRKLAT